MFGAKLNAHLISDANQTPEKYYMQSVAVIACIVLYSYLLSGVKHFLEINFRRLRCAVVTRWSKTASPHYLMKNGQEFGDLVLVCNLDGTHIDCNVTKLPRSA